MTGAGSQAACLCKRAREGFEGFFQPLPADKEDAGADDRACVVCPAGADCSTRDGLVVAELAALPGYWRPSATSLVFSDCAVGFAGLDSEKRALAEERCCPGDQCTNKTFIEPSEQCLKGYTGALCLVCADGYVPASAGSMDCTSCAEGASFVLALGAMVGMSGVPLFLIALALLLTGVSEDKVEKGHSVFGSIKIMISYLQIMSSMPSVMESVPWPDSFLGLALPLTAINLNFLGVFSAATCSLSVRFPQQFLITMAMPLVLAMSAVLANLCANVCAKDKTAEGKHFRAAKSIKIVIVIVLFIFPSLCEKVFTMLRCRQVDGIDDGLVLVADWSVRCGQGEHIVYAALALVFMLVYILGIPMTMLVLLYRKRNALYDESHPEHKDVYYQLGGLYSNFEPRYYWFEIVNVLHKMLMTGAIVVIAPGTAAQPLVAMLFQLFYLLLVLKLAP